MTSKLSCIMLIDDSMSDNYLHERLITRMGCAKHVASMRTGHGALDHFTSADKKVCLPPDLILLDTDMPHMNGWDFLEAYEKLHKLDKSGVIVMMADTVDSQVAERVCGMEAVKDIVEKPLTEDTIRQIINLHLFDSGAPRK